MASGDRNDEDIVSRTVQYTDRREVILDSLEDLLKDTTNGNVSAIAMAVVMDDGSVRSQWAHRKDSDHVVLLGATQLLVQDLVINIKPTKND